MRQNRTFFSPISLIMTLVLLAGLGATVWRRLYRQTTSLEQARLLLALWHSVHIPLGLTLFTTAFIHIGVAIYYATLLR